MRRTFLKAGAACGAQLMLGAAHAQPAPGKPLEWVIGMAAGGGSDAVARSVAEAWAKPIHRNIVVINKPGAGTNIAAEYAARSRDYGNIIFTADFATLAANPHLFPKLAYNAEQDFVPVSMLVRFPLLLVVGNQSPIHNFQEFKTWAKANPDKLTYGTPGLGTPHHLATELLAQQMGVKMTHAPYRGGGPAMLDIIGGQIPFMLVDSATGIPHITAGKARAIGVASAQRLKSLPQVPTLIEQGVTGFEAFAWQGVVAPKGTDDATVQMWSRTLQETLKAPAVQARFEALALEPMPSSPEQMREFWLAEKRRWGQIIKTAGIKLD